MSYSYARKPVQASRTVTAGPYNDLFSNLVREIDAIDEGLKKVPAALAALKKIEDHVKKDPEFKEREKGLNLHAPEQQIGYMREILDRAKNVQERLGDTYDVMDGVFMRLGLK